MSAARSQSCQLSRPIWLRLLRAERVGGAGPGGAQGGQDREHVGGGQDGDGQQDQRDGRHPDAAAIGPSPSPRAARASMSPITEVPSHRRESSHAGRRTCVAPHETHRARRGRTATGNLPP